MDTIPVPETVSSDVLNVTKSFIENSKLFNPVPDYSFFRIPNFIQRSIFGRANSANDIWIIERHENSKSKEMEQSAKEPDVLDLLVADNDFDMTNDFGKREQWWKEEMREMEE